MWSLDDLLASGHVEARGMLQPGRNGKLGSIRLVPQPVQFDAAERISGMSTPTLGQHTEEVLKSKLSLDDARLAVLRAAKAI